MGTSLDVNSQTFPLEVLEKSYETTVIVDFYATWCGPCQILKPILEKLVQEYDFVLAKVDIDKNPDLATQWQIEGVPDVRVVQEGQMQPGFVGALPEPQLREFLQQFNLQSDLEIKLAQIQEAIATNQIPQAKTLFDQLFEAFPNSPIVTLEAAKFLIHINQGEQAKKLLDSIDLNNAEYFNKAQSLKALIEFKTAAEQSPESELDQKYITASRYVLSEDYEAALQGFLEIASENRSYREDGARKAMTAIFALLGNNHPLAQKYQKELMLTLY